MGELWVKSRNANVQMHSASWAATEVWTCCIRVLASHVIRAAQSKASLCWKTGNVSKEPRLGVGCTSKVHGPWIKNEFGMSDIVYWHCPYTAGLRT